MSIVRTFGEPDLFVTVTCNPMWRKITENLLRHQTDSDWPDLVACVFNTKKDALIKMIIKDNVFGEVIAFNWVIEFQKRTLPHLHMLITLKHDFKIKTTDKVEQFVSAVIPNKTKKPTVYNIVTKSLLHGPCGDWCIVNEKCSKNFPKEFRNETTMDDNVYPYYRRKDKGITFSRNDQIFNNRHVVPYDPTLSETFNCHINVEIVS
ncbi:uncharacterized protein LOC128668015 [Microplitis demolitor]|uniref:uncharacterized protein LOC128668015 n=1 Tax=Microplitis demolitor TaxID=69319 RepID=UPI00235B5D15|nr:uncharacterized protein LOC128668015 [Microplitis demolitor]